ncbi:putative tyrosine phosphatase [Leishmania infantum JPCM5]|uniref:Tyrosine_phosphatase_-__putative n=2 Tax=Leishmania infantum TaxID=5671 RepID=A0A6L0WJ15_LEIIN|nr:putative tyrosine phosphatase [Leishmania infantum JPCM5]CAC9453749.1 tyrosine_phosphatase_-__putative [Leishmania infantum]CAM65862.2 putative tyrosine phosphatase [Leishmania infantum JPCM5]SUZ39496.1 tyrosine_phosphatase_-__putative [Leishmania infantum]|eukprot:XP_001463497.2 putative tyrosine phosphatase [Leishmania infantum JPCM5]
MSVAMEAIHDFYFKENFFASGVAGACRKGSSTRTIPTARAAVGQDAVFVSLRGIPPYLYRPFFADFGPLDMSCCVHFARRLCELLRAVTGFDVRASPASAAAAGTFSNGTNSGAAAPAHRKRGGRGQPASAPSCSPSSASAVSTVSSSGCPLGATLPVVVCASLDAQERVNTACLVGAFCVLCLGWSAVATWYRGFVDIYPGFLAYRDASQGVSNYPLSLIDVWAGLEQGVALGLVNVHTFDIPAFLEGKQYDYSWVVPRRFLAMSSPQDDKSARTAEVFARRLRPLGVRLVVRLNDNLYNPSPLLRLGIRHVDLPYADGSVPCDAMLLRFLQAVEEHFGESVAPVSLQEWWSVPSSSAATARAGSASTKASSARASHRRPALQPCSLMHSGTCRGMPEAWTAVPPSAPPSHARRPDSAHANRTQCHDTCTLAPGDKGAVAVHCLAGLGRTGTMLAVYMMRHYGFTARAVIGWMRLCRPGSITGIQQQYLDAMERRLRPPPHMLAALQLNSAAKLYGAVGGGRRFELPSRRTRSSSLSVISSTSALPNAAAAAQTTHGRDGAVAMGRNQLDASPQPPLGKATTGCMRSTAAVTAFQTHGSVVADAQPATATATSIVVGHIRRDDSGRSSAMAARAASDVARDIGTFTGLAAWTDLTGLRGAQQQRQQLLMRRFSNSSTATLSLSTIQEGGEALDVVARMPVLGDNSPQNRSAATASLKRGSATAAASYHKTSIHPSPRVDDYKYASTYFVAMERVGELPRVYPWSTSSAAASAARGEPGGAHGGGPRPATANTYDETAPRGTRHLGRPRLSECSIGSDASRAKETRTAPASADSCLRPRKGLTSALQRRRPYTAAAAVSVGPQLHAKRYPTHYERGGAADHSETGTHAPGGTPPCSDLSEKTQQSPRRRQAATRTRVRWDDKGAHRANLDDARAGDTAAADPCVDVKLQTPHPPSAPMRSSLPWRDGGVTELEDGPRSPLVLSRSSLAIPATSLPMWARPMLRT